MVNTNSQSKPNSAGSALGQLESTLEEYLVKKAPFTLPDNIKEIIVKFAPWITLILLVLALPGILFVLGVGTFLMPVSYLGGVRAGAGFSIAMIFTVITLVLEVIALPGLFKRSIKAWRLIYYSSLVSAVGSLISFNLGALIIGTLISLYILFQVKEKYS